MTLPHDPRFEVADGVPPGSLPEESDWVDYSERINRLSAVFGRAGTVSGLSNVELDNYDRTIDLTLMRHARLAVIVQGTRRDVWQGFINAAPPKWPGYNRAVVSAALEDATAWLALQDIDLELPRQLSHERVTALLDAAAWPTELRDIEPGVVRLAPFDQTSANIFRTLTDTVDAEDGVMYVGVDGKIVYRSRHHRFDADPQSIAATGEDTPGLAVQAVDPSRSADTLTNIVRVELADGKVYELVDQTSIDNYGPRSTPVRDLALPGSEADGLGKWLIYKHSVPNTELPGLEFVDPDPAELDEILQRRVGDLITFVHQPPGGGSPVELPGHIERIHHRIDSGPWQTTWDLTPYFGEGPWFTWNDPDRGWNSGARWAP